MPKKETNKYFYIISVIVALLVIGITISASFAFFTNTGSSTTGTATVITSGSLSLELVDGNVVGTTEGMVPGDSIQKKFKVKNIGSVDTVYDIFFSEVINTFADKSDLVYRIISNDGGYNTVSDQIVPSEVGEQSKIISNKVIGANQEHNYTLEIIFLSKNENQDDNKGKKFSGKLQINEYKNLVTLLTGSEINKKIMQIANPDVVLDDEYYYWFYEENINSIQKAPTLDDSASKELISPDGSDTPVYIWFDNGTLYYYSTLDKVLLNSDSSNMFSGLGSLTSLDLSGFDSSLVTNMSGMFSDLAELESLNLSDFDTSNVVNMSGMFSGLRNMTSLDLSHFNTSSVENMSSMFSSTKLNNINLSSFNTSRVKNMSSMFYNSTVSNIIFGNIDTSSVTNMSSMFYGLNNMRVLDLSNFDTSNVVNMRNMFTSSSNLETIYVGDYWNTNSVADEIIFGNCNALIGGEGTSFNSKNTYKSYAHIDYGEDYPGYLTYKASADQMGENDPSTYTIYYNANGADINTKKEIINRGSSTTLPDVSLRYHKFLGWYTNFVNGEKVGEIGDSYTPVSSQILYAKWFKPTYTVAANSDNTAVCITAYNNEQYCISKNYWSSHGSSINTVESALKSEMESSFVNDNIDCWNEDLGWSQYTGCQLDNMPASVTVYESYIYVRGSANHCQMYSDGSIVCE